MGQTKQRPVEDHFSDKALTPQERKNLVEQNRYWKIKAGKAEAALEKAKSEADRYGSQLSEKNRKISELETTIRNTAEAQVGFTNEFERLKLDHSKLERNYKALDSVSEQNAVQMNFLVDENKALKLQYGQLKESSENVIAGLELKVAEWSRLYQKSDKWNSELLAKVNELDQEKTDLLIEKMKTKESVRSLTCDNEGMQFVIDQLNKENAEAKKEARFHQTRKWAAAFILVIETTFLAFKFLF